MFVGQPGKQLLSPSVRQLVTQSAKQLLSLSLARGLNVGPIVKSYSLWGSVRGWLIKFSTQSDYLTVSQIVGQSVFMQSVRILVGTLVSQANSFSVTQFDGWLKLFSQYIKTLVNRLVSQANSKSVRHPDS